VSSTYVGLQLGTYLYPDAGKRFRFGANMSYYAALNNTIEISEDNSNTLSSSNKQATIGLGISAGYSVSLTSNTCMWIEPNAQIFLRKNSTSDGLANFQPHTIGLNFIFQHIK
jgi:outer membrane autotransporter protein